MNYRYCARVLVEAATPLKIGTGETGLNIDELVATDANGLPIIPGTAITGVLRHSFDSAFSGSLFGFQDGKSGEGSRLIISNANFVGEDGEVIDGLADINFNEGFYSKFKKMAVRDHVRINHKGVADKEKRGKYDSQAVFKGCRFVFDIELKGNEEDKDPWKTILTKLSSPLFRIGSGTRKGFGELSVLKAYEEIFDLSKDSNAYMERSSRLTVPKNNVVLVPIKEAKIVQYELYLKPDDFFMFSAGYGDREVDLIAKKEPYVVWKDGKPAFSKEKILIPATSVKGAISHRTAYHHNRLSEVFVDTLKEDEKIDGFIGENNTAVKEIFGYAKNSDVDESFGQRGRAIFSDLFVENSGEKIFNHVAIDRFTGGAMDGALFDEKVTFTDEQIVLKVVVESEAFSEPNIQEAFETALKDIATGMLPLGGSVMRGHGCFNGKVLRNGEEI